MDFRLLRKVIYCSSQHLTTSTPQTMKYNKLNWSFSKKHFGLQKTSQDDSKLNDDWVSFGNWSLTMKNFTQFHKSARNNRTNFAALCESPLANWIRWLNIGNWAYGHRRHVINIRAGFLPHLSIVRFTFWSRRITMTISSRATLAGCCGGRKFDLPRRFAHEEHNP